MKAYIYHKLKMRSYFNLLVLFSLINSMNGFSQSPRDYVTNNMFWSEVNVIGSIKGKFKYQFDYQYRRQAFNSDSLNKVHNNPFLNRFQLILRPWVHYQLNPNVRFSLSPIAWWGTWSAPGNNVTKFTPEYRISPQITLIQKIGRIEFSHRYRYEFRFIGLADTAIKTFDFLNNDSYIFKDSNKRGRFRYFLRAIIPLNHKELEDRTIYLNMFDEIFLGLGKNTGNYNLLDQNRCFAGAGYKYNKYFRFELGYFNQAVFRFSNPAHRNVDINNILQVYIIVDNFNDLLKKKEKNQTN